MPAMTRETLRKYLTALETVYDVGVMLGVRLYS